MAKPSKLGKSDMEAEREAIAEALLALAPRGDFLATPAIPLKSDYLPLQTPIAKSNKNAVSIHNDFVSFMVPDWSLDTDAQQLSFKTKRNMERGKRLYVYGVSSARITVNADFFTKILRVAELESRERQGERSRP